MLQIYIIDDSAESRSEASAAIDSLLRAPVDGFDIVPRVSLRSLAPEEINFHGKPDLYVIGPRIAESRAPFIATLRKSCGTTPIIALTTRERGALLLAEQLARAGVDDVLSPSAAPQEFLKRVVILARRRAATSGGKLILVDSGKGGLGCTSLTAALGESLVELGKRVLVVDLDSETQDLARFLQARPYVNDALELMLSQSRPLNEEFAAQAVCRVWSDVENFYCMPPPAPADESADPWTAAPRVTAAVFELLDHLYDVVIVDGSSARGGFLRALYRMADDIVFVVDSDPASLFAGAQRLSRGVEVMAHDARLTVVQSELRGGEGLSRVVLQRELKEAVGIGAELWTEAPLRFCRSAQRWPGSGLTLRSAGNGALHRALDQILERVNRSEAAGAAIDHGLIERLAAAACSVVGALLGAFRGRTARLRPGPGEIRDSHPGAGPALPWSGTAAAPLALLGGDPLITPPRISQLT